MSVETHKGSQRRGLPVRTPSGVPRITDVSAARLAQLRVLIVHDWIVAWGGAERTVAELLALFPWADLMVGVLGEENRDLNDVTRRAEESWVAKLPFARSHHRWFLPLYAPAFATLDTRGYDLVISSSSSFSKTVRTSRDTRHLCYCHSPPRYLWDLRGAYREDSGISGLALAMAGPLLRRVDRASAQRVDRFVANSGYIADRIQRAYDRDSAVIYPPVSLKPASGVARVRDDRFLVLGRLVPYKRVDLAIEAANRTGATLVVAGDGPERARLEALAGPTVSFLGQVSEEQAGELLDSCAAMIFCAEEDFGIAPVEANAHGMPVVAYGRGGARESLVDGVTAEFFAEQTVESLAAAMTRVTRRAWDDAAIRENAARFSPEAFRSGMAAEVATLMEMPNRK